MATESHAGSGGRGGCGPPTVAALSLLLFAVLGLCSDAADGIRWLALRRATGPPWSRATSGGPTSPAVHARRDAPQLSVVSAACGRARRSLGLSRAQARLCRRAADAMPLVARAASQTAVVCAGLFKDRRWNCSSLDSAPRLSPDLTTGTREQAFVYALSSASVAFSVARACSAGGLHACSCGSTPAEPPDGDFKWGGCGDNMRYGLHFGRAWADAGHGVAAQGGVRRKPAQGDRPRPTSAAHGSNCSRWERTGASRRCGPAAGRPQGTRGRVSPSPGNGERRRGVGMRGRTKKARGPWRALITVVNLHNNRAGRRAVEWSVSTQCKCHGVSGSCSIKTCWKALPRLQEVGERLKRQYAVATEVVPGHGWLDADDATALRAVAGAIRQRHRPRGPAVPPPGGRRRRLLQPAATAPEGDFNDHHLIYVTKSPDYCSRDPRVGSQGTSGRWCNASSQGHEGCGSMCCGRGHVTFAEETVERCHCKYYWCCYVKCKTCRRWTERHRCN